MGYSHVGRLTAYQETTFGTSQVVSNDRDQRVVRAPDFSGLVTGRAPDQTHYDRLHEVFQRVDLSEFGSKVTIPVYLDGLAAGLVSSSAGAYPENDVSVLLRSLMGGANTPAVGSTALSGSVSSVIVQAGAGSNFAQGGACYVSGTGCGFAEIGDVSGDTLHFKMALSTAPTTGATVFNSVTFYFDEDNFGGDTDSLIIRYVGNLTNDHWRLFGCCGDFTISSEIDSLLSMVVNLQVAAWTKDGSSGITLTGASYDGGGPLACKSGQVLWQTAGTVSRNILACDKFTITPGIKYEAERALNGVETILRYRMLRADTKASLEFNAYNGFDDFWTDTDSQSTIKQMCLVLGSAPISGATGTGMVAFSMPRVQYTARPKRMSNGEILRVAVDLEAREDNYTGGGSGPATGQGATADLERAKFRIHLL